MGISRVTVHVHTLLNPKPYIFILCAFNYANLDVLNKEVSSSIFPSKP